MATSNGLPASIRRLRSAAKAYSIVSRWPVARSKAGAISRKMGRGAALLKTLVSSPCAATPCARVSVVRMAAVAAAVLAMRTRVHITRFHDGKVKALTAWRK